MSLSQSAIINPAAWLCQQLSQQVQQLVELVERHCRSAGRHPSLINESVVVGTAIAQLTCWLPRGHASKVALQKLEKVLPALLQAREATALQRLLQLLYSLHQQL